MIDQDAIESTILRLASECGPGGTFSPTEAAVALGGHKAEEWGPLMQPVRRAAVALAKSGRIVIYRKSKPADPDAFKGTYRLGPPRED
jgi:hypothetical protein